MIAWRVGRGRAPDLRELVFVLGALAAAAVSAYELVHGNERVAVVLSALPLVAWLLIRPRLLLIPLGASIPLITSITGSNSYGSGGYNVALSDVCLVVISAGILLEGAVALPVPILRALQPVRFPIAQYGAVMVLLLSFHHHLHDVLKTGQRFELFLLPVLVGIYAAYLDKHLPVLKAYVLASTLLALIFPVDSFGLQHNPVGQMIANAILVLVALRPLRGYYPCLVVLVPGLVLTGSRGSILAAGIGIVVIVVMKNVGVRTLVRYAAPVAVLAGVAFFFAPASLQDRLTTLTPGTQSTAAYALYIREGLSSDAHKIINEHPWTGVGIGNYLNADLVVDPTGAVDDPHDVLLLQEAEGGYGLAASFILLVAATAFALWRMRRAEIAVAAAAVLLATFAHGFVDVYWVRATPVLSWLMVGMACGCYARLRQTESAAAA